MSKFIKYFLGFFLLLYLAVDLISRTFMSKVGYGDLVVETLDSPFDWAFNGFAEYFLATNMCLHEF